MKVVCIGSGNVATHVANALKAGGADLIQIWSKHFANAAVLAKATGSQPISALNEIDRNADLYLIAVKDDAILEIAGALKGVNGMAVHTSGATDINALSAVKNHGVFYPLQTFTKAKPVDFIHVPLCLEANNPDNLALLKSVAIKLTPLVYQVDSEKRKILHLAAVFACNFVNHLYQLSQQILQENNLDFEILRPLIMETAEKVQTALPADVQTGPAIRNDEQTISKQEELLRNMPDLQEIYKNLSKSIKKTS